MAEIRAKKKLEEVFSKGATSKITVEQVLQIFKNEQNKYTAVKLSGFANSYIKPNILDGDKLFAQYDINIKKHQKTPYEALIIMMNNATVIQQGKPPIAEKPNLSKLSVRSDFESPALSSTRYETNTPEIVVSEVRRNPLL